MAAWAVRGYDRVTAVRSWVRSSTVRLCTQEVLPEFLGSITWMSWFLSWFLSPCAYFYMWLCTLYRNREVWLILRGIAKQLKKKIVPQGKN